VNLGDGTKNILNELISSPARLSTTITATTKNRFCLLLLLSHPSFAPINFSGQERKQLKFARVCNVEIVN